jgi:hypothetical protein
MQRLSHADRALIVRFAAACAVLVTFVLLCRYPPL